MDFVPGDQQVDSIWWSLDDGLGGALVTLVLGVYLEPIQAERAT